MSPINFDPRKPLFSISYPNNYSSKLVKRTGPYHTQGMPYDIFVLTEDRLDEKAFLEIVDEILRENDKVLDEGIKEYKEGLLFFYFEILDIIQHVFWRYLDPQHPLYEKDSPYQDTIFKYYKKIDQIIGKVLKSLDKDATLIILSDHGFSSARRDVDLNRWLLENGYLFLKEDRRESRELFENVDWARTKAYALGLGNIYLNRANREYHGIVDNSEVCRFKAGNYKRIKTITGS